MVFNYKCKCNVVDHYTITHLLIELYISDNCLNAALTFGFGAPPTPYFNLTSNVFTRNFTFYDNLFVAKIMPPY